MNKSTKQLLFVLLIATMWFGRVNADEQTEHLRLRYTASLLGVGLDYTDPNAIFALRKSERNIESLISKMEQTDYITNVFTDINLPKKGQESIAGGQNINAVFSRLRSVAIGLMTPENRYYYTKNDQNRKLLSWSLSALEYMTKFYSVETFPIYYQDLDGDGRMTPFRWVDLNGDGEKQEEEYEWRRCNWWHMEIGIPKDLNDILVLLYDHLPSTLLESYLAAIDVFIPSPDWTTGGAAGANGTWATHNVAIRAILAGNPTPKELATPRYGYSVDKLTAAKIKTESLINTFKMEAGVKTYREGFYDDGSCISHSRNSYTGGYGVGMLGDNISLIKIFDGSRYAISPEKRAIVSSWIKESFMPLMAYGSIMDYTRGREISRPHEGIGTGCSVVSTMINFISIAPMQDRPLLKSYVKQQMQYINDYIGEDKFFGSMHPSLIAIAREIQADSTIAMLGEHSINKVFPIMNRVVHHSNGFIAGVAAHSKRIFNYEGLNSENSKGWHTSDGMFYLYNGFRDHYNDEYWPTVDSHYLAGTTVERQSEMASGNKVGRNDWCGGVTLSNKYGIFGQQLMPDTPATLSANKSYFFLDNIIVFLGSGITDDALPQVVTVIENRKVVDDASAKMIVDGLTVASDGTQTTRSFKAPRWAHLSSSSRGADIGYLFLDNNSVDFQSVVQAGAWRDINTYQMFDNDEVAHRPYMTMMVNHGSRPVNAQYAYAIIPNATAEQTRKMSVKSEFIIIDNRAEVGAIRKGRITMANFWSAATLSDGSIGVDAPACVAMEKGVKIVVTDPAQTAETLKLTVKGKIKLAQNARVIGVESKNGSTTVTLNTKELFGSHIDLTIL